MHRRRDLYFAQRRHCARNDDVVRAVAVTRQKFDGYDLGPKTIVAPRLRNVRDVTTLIASSGAQKLSNHVD